MSELSDALDRTRLVRALDLEPEEFGPMFQVRREHSRSFRRCSRILGPPATERQCLVSFTLDYAHPHDVATVLDREGVCVRAGHHCAQPLHQAFGIPATTRASFHVYNLPRDIEALYQGLLKVHALFGK